MLGPSGLSGVITVFRTEHGAPQRDELDLVTVYAGYAASAIERDRLLDQVTTRNRVLETIREMLETLAGPVLVSEGLVIALQSLRRGLQAGQKLLERRLSYRGQSRTTDTMLSCRQAVLEYSVRREILQSQIIFRCKLNRLAGDKADDLAPGYRASVALSLAADHLKHAVQWRLLKIRQVDGNLRDAAGL